MEISLKEISKIVTGNTPSKKNKNYWNSEDICFIKPDVIGSGIDSITTSNEYISNFASSKARIVDRNTILITCIGNIGRIGIVSDKKVAFNQQINAIIPDYKINIRYLAYVLLFSQPRLNALANSAVVPIVNKTQLGNFKVKINPNLESQGKIVSILDKIAKIIKNQTKEIKRLDELIKARFVEMFGDIIHNSKKLPTKSLHQICNNVSGGTPSRKHLDYYGGNIPFVTTVALGPNYIDAEDAQDYLTEEGVKESATRKIPVNSILFGNRVGVGKSSINKVEVCINQDIIALTDIDFEKNNLLFLKMVLDEYKEYFEVQKRGATIKGIPSKIVKNISIPIVSLSFQNEFANFVQQVDKSKVAVQKSLDETQKLFDSLMQEYFG